MGNIALLTLDPDTFGGGGVPAMLRVAYDFVASREHEPALLYSTLGDNSGGRVGRLARYLRHSEAQAGEWRGMQSRAVAAPPLPLWMYYASPRLMRGPAVEAFDMHLAISGSSHVALPLAKRGLPYLLWTATDYEDELAAKRELGDAWATNVLSSPAWPILKQQEAQAYRGAARILTLSDHTASIITRKWPDIGDRLEVVPFPIDTSQYHPDDDPATRPIAEPYLLLTARINDPRKNVTMLLEAFASVRHARPDMRLVLIGDAPGPDLKAALARLALDEAVTVIQELPREALIPYYQHAELFVLSSTQEGLGISMLEALACGTPVVATRCGGPEGVVREGVSGLLVANRDGEAFAAAILRLLGNGRVDPALRQRCAEYAAGRFGRSVVEGQFAAAFEAVYGETFSNPNHTDATLTRKTAARWRQVAAVAWVLAITVLYFARQIPPQWPKVYERFIAPLLGILGG